MVFSGYDASTSLGEVLLRGLMRWYWHSSRVAVMVVPMVLLSPLIALNVYRGTFASFKDAIRYFLYLGDSKGSVEVSQVALRINSNAVIRLRESLQTYALQHGMVVKVDSVRSTTPDRQIFGFHLVGQAFHIVVNNAYEEENLFVATIFDCDKQDWHVYRDEFVTFFASAFGRENVCVIE